MLIDMAGICKREEYWEELDIMENMNKTYSQTLLERGEARGVVIGEARGKKQSKLEIAKNLIGKISNFKIADVTGLPLVEVEQLSANLS